MVYVTEGRDGRRAKVWVCRGSKCRAMQRVGGAGGAPLSLLLAWFNAPRTEVLKSRAHNLLISLVTRALKKIFSPDRSTDDP